ncbi:MAG: hypothetical protein HZA83_00975, partial [Thaumarchaeota archaeon]|nr:hypothetical protein [Nitrososphaerota archaeon]
MTSEVGWAQPAHFVKQNSANAEFCPETATNRSSRRTYTSFSDKIRQANLKEAEADALGRITDELSFGKAGTGTSVVSVQSPAAGQAVGAAAASVEDGVAANVAGKDSAKVGPTDARDRRVRTYKSIEELSIEELFGEINYFLNIVPRDRLRRGDLLPLVLEAKYKLMGSLRAGDIREDEFDKKNKWLSEAFDVAIEKIVDGKEKERLRRRFEKGLTLRSVTPLGDSIIARGEERPQKASGSSRPTVEDEITRLEVQVSDAKIRYKRAVAAVTAAEQTFRTARADLSRAQGIFGDKDVRRRAVVPVGEAKLHADDVLASAKTALGIARYNLDRLTQALFEARARLAEAASSVAEAPANGTAGEGEAGAVSESAASGEETAKVIASAAGAAASVANAMSQASSSVTGASDEERQAARLRVQKYLEEQRRGSGQVANRDPLRKLVIGETTFTLGAFDRLGAPFNGDPKDADHFQLMLNGGGFFFRTFPFGSDLQRALYRFEQVVAKAEEGIRGRELEYEIESIIAKTDTK